jgi:hypothetical protein
LKKTILFFLLFSTCLCAAQSWQWGKRGGSINVLSTTSNNRPEQVYSIVTDPARNIYTLSPVGKNDLDIDGNPKTNFADLNTITDYALSSFACDGTYRWSKIIGGAGNERIAALQTDSEGNIFVSGRFSNCSALNDYPARIENDVILDQNATSCSAMFIAKFNAAGDLLWFKRPQALTTQSIALSQSTTQGLSTDAAGNSSILVQIPPGTYGDGAFINTLEGSNFYILKYDTNGNFTGYTYLDMQLESSAAFYLNFYHNLNNGHYYFTGRKEANDTAVIGGQAITHGFFLTSFDATGQFLWKRESNYTDMGMSAYNLVFDTANNIYMGGRFIGLNTETFLTYSVAEPITPSYLMKLNPTADTILWVTNGNKGSSDHGAISIKGDEIALTSYCGLTEIWGNQTMFVNNMNEGTRALLARFNKDTGSCTALTFIPSNNGFQNLGASIAVDAAGDYILGGSFAGTQTFATNTTSYVGGQTDFFVAKYAMSPCSDLGIESKAKSTFKIYPNPAKNDVTLQLEDTTVQATVVLYDLLGKKIYEASLPSGTSSYQINTQSYPAGLYLVVLKQNNNVIDQHKLIIQ